MNLLKETASFTRCPHGLRLVLTCHFLFTCCCRVPTKVPPPQPPLATLITIGWDAPGDADNFWLPEGRGKLAPQSGLHQDAYCIGKFSWKMYLGMSQRKGGKHASFVPKTCSSSTHQQARVMALRTWAVMWLQGVDLNFFFFVPDNQEQKFPQTGSVQTFPLKLLLDDEDVLSLLRYFLCAMLLKQAHFSSSGVFLSMSTWFF